MRKATTVDRVLLVDDVPENLDVLQECLAPAELEILAASSGEMGLKVARKALPSLILLDVNMPEMDGFTVCRQLKDDPATHQIPVIFITARDDVQSLRMGFAIGGVDFITKPFDAGEVLSRVGTHLQLHRANQELREKNESLAKELKRRLSAEKAAATAESELSLARDSQTQHWGVKAFIGKSRVLKKILSDIEKLQRVPTSVLIEGESGCGKELVARAIHEGSSRSQGKFIPVNCAAIPAELMESMFFGHKKGAFTGANTDRSGYLVLADQGTLFLDEVSEMSVPLQAKLLRVLEDGRVMALGDMREKKVDVRILAASNANIESKIREGQFRQDLYFRLACFRVNVPPLRERSDDVPLLVNHFMTILAHELGFPKPSLNEEAIEILCSYSFPGNVRELKNIIERALIESDGAEIGPEHLHFFHKCVEPPSNRTSVNEDPPADSDKLDLPLNLQEAEEMVIAQALKQAGGNISAAARLLGIHRAKLYRRIKG